MSKKTIGIGLGIGAAGILGYALTKLIAGNAKEKRAKRECGGRETQAAPDSRPGNVNCPSCGAAVREYDFFCPVCRHPMEQKKADAGSGTAGPEQCG